MLLFHASIVGLWVFASGSMVPAVIPGAGTPSHWVAPGDDVKMFPAPKEGYKRVVIRLPAIEGEATVEIVATRIEQVDAVNRHSIAGELKAATLQGWGYGYYELEAAPHCLSTKMAGPAEQMAPRPTLVRIHGAGFSGLNYNSKLPLVLYVPENVEVSYRVWTPGAAQPAGEG